METKFANSLQVISHPFPAAIFCQSSVDQQPDEMPTTESAADESSLPVPPHWSADAASSSEPVHFEAAELPGTELQEATDPVDMAG
jgi:hypothetical protein